MRKNNINNTKNQDTLLNEIMKEYWLKALSGDLTGTTLPMVELSQPGFRREERKRFQYPVADVLHERIMSICNHVDMAFFVFLAAALNALLYRYSGNESIITGTTNFEIKEEYDAGNILILKNHVSGNLSFKELLAGVKDVVLGAYKNRAYPFEKIKGWLKANRKLDVREFLHIVFVFEQLQAQPDGLQEFDLVIRYFHKDQRNWLVLEYNQDIYHDTVVHQFANHFINFLSHVPEALDTCIEEIEILSEADRYVLLHSFNTVERKHALGDNEDTELVMIRELFEQQVERSPDGVAVTCAKQHQVTYDELNKRTNQLACQLRGKGVKPGTIVALVLVSSLEMVIGMLAVLKSGGVYLPIDPGYPANRKQYILRDSCATLIVVHRHWVDREQNKEVLQDFIAGGGDRVIIIDEGVVYAGESTNPGVITGPGDPAYINYTSGTSGKPKGVVVSHGNLLAYMDSFFNEFAIGPGDTVLQQASYSFDVIVEELYPVLLRGGRLAIPGDKVKADIDLLVEFMVERDVTFISCSPIMLSELNKRLPQYKNRLRIHTFINGGDVLGKGHIDNLLEIGNVYNTYGPTETTVCATYYRCDAGKGIPASIPIGKPILNSRVYIVDAGGGLVPIGAAGELCISGEGVSLGYLNQPLLTAERFVFVSYKSYRTYRTYIPGKLYKTGDLARWLPDGNIEFLGRKDRQVKVQGYRVELEEIEKRLVRHSLVGEAVVVVRENEKGDRYLCAYIVPGTADDVDVSLLRRALAVNLPDYMIPPYIMTLERIPLTAHGKVDRLALPAPAAEVGGIYTAPRNREEMKLVEIWSELLRTEKERIGIDSNFFRLGGHSLTATQLVYRIHKDMGVDLELRDVFIHPTVSELAGKITSSEFLEYVRINNIEEKEYYDLSYAQRRLWVLCQFEEDSTAYNMPDAFIMCGNIEVEVFKGALQALARRHEGLRTVFIIADGGPKQKIIKDFSLEVEAIDLRAQNLNPGAIEEEGRKIFREAANWVFDLEHGPLVHFRLVRLEEQKYLFITNIHHIINDAWSQGMMNNELVELYNAFLADKEHALPPLELQYKDYTCWHNELIEGGGFADVGKYWLEKYKDKPNGIELPRDHPRRPVQTFNGRRVHFSIPGEHKQRLYSLCLSHDSTLFMGLLTLVDIFMYRYSGQADISIGSPIAGRRRKELQGIVGFLVNTLVYRNEVDPSGSFETLLKKVREETLACYGNQDYPFDLLVDQLELERDLSQSPLFNVMLAHNNADTQEIELVMKGVEISGYPYDDFNMSKFDLIFFMDEVEEGIYVRLEYNSDLFEDGTAERMAANFLILTESVLSHPDQPLYSLDYIHPREYETIVRGFNDNREEFPRLTVQELFEQQAAKTPEQTAVVGDASHITYHELNKKANQLAHYLREEFSVTPGDIVGISIDRSPEMIFAISGIIKSGGGYLAIDPTYPEERVLHMLADSRCRLVIMDRPRPHLFGNYKGKQIDIFSHWEIIGAKSAENPPVVNGVSDVLYVIYTSGSTGTPNGAMLSHGILSNLVQWQHQKTTVDCSLRCLQFTSVNFCVSFQEITVTLTAGGEVHLIGDIERQDIDYLMDFLVQHRIQLLYLPFSYLNFLFNESGRWSQSFNHCLKHIITAGEQLKITAGLKRFLEKNPEVQLHNHYGSSEMHVVTSYTLDASTAARVPIPPAGQPIANTAIYILDEYNNPVPIGVWGELCIAGSREVLGYIHNPVLTDQKLFFHPVFSKDNKRLYRSGDLGRWLEDGNIELKGRKDFQVKIRGFRVEPGEIESKILAVEGVRDCVVEVKESPSGKDQTGTSGQKYLVGYVVLEKKGANRNELDAIYRGLGHSLPQYMIPQLLVLDSLPLMPNGKVDREKLPVPEFHGEEEYTAPRNETEARLAQIWAELLGIEPGRVSVDANFFELGGHSLKATKMISEIHKAFHVRIPLTEVFQSPVIGDLSKYISGAEAESYVPLELVEEKEYYDLSYAQRRLWILCQFEEDSTAYNMPGAFFISGSIDIRAFKEAVYSLARRHESLRTVFIPVKGEPKQRILKELKLNLDPVDLRGLGREAGEAKARGIYREDANQAFNLEKGPLILFKAVQLENDKYLFIYNIHHIVNDGWSQGIIFNELVTLYNMFARGLESPLAPLKFQYKDYTLWHNELIAGDGFEPTGRYWLEKFKDKPGGIELPLDHPRRPIQTFNGRRVPFTIDAETTLHLRRLCPGQNEGGDKVKAAAGLAGNDTGDGNATLFMVLLTLVDIFLYKYSGQGDILIGSPIAGRRRSELHPVVGFLVNTLVYRTAVEGGESFRALLNKVRRDTLTCYENQDYPFDLLVDRLEPDRDLSQSPLFNVMLAHNNADTRDIELGMDNAEISIYPHADDVNMSKFDLIFFMDEMEDQIYVRLEYNSDLFEAGTVERMAKNFLTLTRNVTGRPQQAICRLDYIDPGEYRTIVQGFNDNEEEFPRLTVHEMFEQQAAKTPEQTAVVGGAAHITFRELNKKANGLAHYLREAFSVKPGDIIGISVDRSIEMIVAILGIIKSGAGYLAIDPGYPEERVLHMLADSQCRLVIVDRMRPQLFGNYTGRMIDIVSYGDEMDLKAAANPVVVNGPSDVLYVIYTSGSTGMPNGAMLSHGILSNLVQWQHYKTSIDCSLRCLQFTSVNFCVSFQEIVITLTAGGEVHLIGEIERQDIDYLMDFLVGHRIRVLYLPFSYLNFLFNESGRWNQSFNHCLKHIITAGEQLKVTSGLKRFLEENPGVQLHNHYGSSEMHVVTSYTLDAARAARVPIPPAGRPISNTAIYILDEYDNPVPIGVFGELCIAGSREVSGYIRNPALTDEKLFLHPVFSKDNKRLYRSGDLGRWLEDGNIELKGRKDFQVKIRGFRVEPGEIESKILSVEGVRDCVVEVKEAVEGSIMWKTSGQKYLVAYVVGAPCDAGKIKQVLSYYLPRYMIPQVAILEGLPLMPNGKVDREKLPEPEFHMEQEYTAPRNEIETRLSEIWSKLLGIDAGSISIHSNFFELGGQSLKATTMVSRIHNVFHVKLPLIEVFKQPTIGELARYILGVEIKERAVSVEPVEKKEHYVLSPAQKRMYILQQVDLESTAYNMPVLRVLQMNIEKEKLENTFRKLIDRRESLRTSFHMVENRPVQRINENVEFEIKYFDLAAEAPGVTGKRGEIQNSFIRPFDLSNAPLLRVMLIKEEEKRYILMVDLHHIICDGISTDLIVNDFMVFYNGSEPPPLRFQYRDYAEWQNREPQKESLKKQETYWLEVFKEGIPVLCLPYDYARPAVQLFAGDAVQFEIGEGDAKSLGEIAGSQGITLYMVLLAVFNVMLAKLSGQEDIVVGTPVAGRRHADLENIIGMFVNTLALRNSPSGRKSFAAFLNELKENTLGAFENQDYPFEELVERLTVPRDAGRNPLFDVMFSLQELGEIPGTPSPGDEPGYREKTSSKFDMTLTAVDAGNGLLLHFTYNTALFRRETIQRFTGFFKEIVSFVTANIDFKLFQVEIMSMEEKQQVLVEFNKTGSGYRYPVVKTINRLFSEQVEKRPDGVAVIGRGAVTYRALNRKSDQLARILREKGVTTNTIVAIMTSPCLEMVIGIMAVLKAGGGYLPIDPENPAGRITYLLKDSNARILLSEGSKVSEVSNEIEVIDVNREIAGNENIEPTPLTPLTHPAQLCYVIYTSGTTGRPRGVLLNHENLVNYVSWFSGAAGLVPGDRTVLTSSFAFDLGYTSIYPSLLKGGELHLLSKERYMLAGSLLDYIGLRCITYLKMTPSLFGVLVKDPGFIEANCRSLRLVVLGGEAINVSDVESARGLCGGIRIMNHYGPTEVTVGCIAQFIDFDEIEAYRVRPTIGRPIGCTRVYILDRYLHVLPAGIAGELCLSGGGVGRGYLNRPELTAEKFDHDLWDFQDYRDKKNYQKLLRGVQGGGFLEKSPPGRRRQTLYKTGDLGRWLLSGNIEFLGRLDQQVKVSGYRIELGEIESHLKHHESVKEAVVMVCGGIAGRGDAKNLCAYIVLNHPGSGDPVEYSELKSYLSHFLPGYMIPSYFVELERIPLTPNGKLDRKALPEPSVSISREYMAPRDANEEKLVETWSEVLEIEKERISINADFFELGGQSLKAVIMLSRIHRALDVKIPLAEIFKNPTIIGVSSYIKGAVGEIDREAYVSIEAVEAREYYELSSAQKRIYILQQMEPKAAVYNMPQFIEMEGEPDLEQLGLYFRQLLARHESLRTSFSLLDDEPVQRIHEQVEFKPEYYEILPDFVRSFDLSQAPMLRVGVLKAGGDRYVLLTDMHHIISDGFSRRILTDDFMSFARGEYLPVLRIQYKDFAQWQNSVGQKEAVKDKEAYWLREFAGEIPVLELPTDYTRPLIQSFAGSSVDFVLDAGETGALRRLESVEGITLYMILSAVCYVLLSKLSGQEDIVVGTPVAGRRHADLENIIGMFVNTLALRNYPSGQKSFAAFLEELKESTLGAFENQDYPFEELVEKLSVQRDTGRNPIFDVMFSWHALTGTNTDADTNTNKHVHPQPSDQTGIYGLEHKISKFDMTLTGVEGKESVAFTFEYCAKLFKRGTIERFTGYFKKIITSILEDRYRTIAEIDILSEEEKRQLLVDFSNAGAGYLEFSPINELLEGQVSRAPGKVAVVTGSCLQVTYGELNERAGELAGIIRTAAGKNNCIGLMFDDNPYLLTAIFAVIKSGNWFVPIAPTYPDDRIDFVVKDCGIKALLTDQANQKKAEAILGRLPSSNGFICICLDIDIGINNIVGTLRHKHDQGAVEESPVHPCYIIYTSGSTGRPKGVLITQENVVPLLVWSGDYYRLGDDTRVLQSLSYWFDMGVFEILSTILFGGCLYQGSRQGLLDLVEYVEEIERQGINIIHTTPSFFNNVVSLGKRMPGLRIVHVGGEILTAGMVIALSGVLTPDCMICNGYGPTEASVNSSIFGLRAGDAVGPASEGMQAISIGKPSANNVIYILDKFNNPRPVEVAGELCVSGRGVSMGYLNRPELTAEKFLHLTLNTQHLTLYKTGDLGRWHAGGNIEFLGRLDQQVKIRGFRIELEEIENRLLETAVVKKAVVIDREINGEKYLCAYIVLAEGAGRETGAPVEELRNYLSLRLPGYMIPSYFMQLEELPLTPGGKTDRRALPVPDRVLETEYAPPGNEIEEQLVEIWVEVLGMVDRPIGIDDNFFELGGHSLNATSMLSRIHRAFDIKIPLISIFKSPTIRSLSGYIKAIIESSNHREEVGEMLILEKSAFDVEFNI